MSGCGGWRGGGTGSGKAKKDGGRACNETGKGSTK